MRVAVLAGLVSRWCGCMDREVGCEVWLVGCYFWLWGYLVQVYVCMCGAMDGRRIGRRLGEDASWRWGCGREGLVMVKGGRLGR